jgi:adenosylcobalamin-dependent ribonucleoside-triphosphate reductase
MQIYTSPIISEEFLKKYKGTNPNFGFNGLGFIVYRRTYSRLKSDETYEEWYETVARCVNGAQELGADYTKEEAEKLYDYVFNLKCSFAGRMLWMLGTDHLKRWGGNALLNCWFTTITEYEDFCFIFENLMLGGGVGFSIRREDIHELPKVKENIKVIHKSTNDADFIVPDSREGWVYLLRQVLKSYFRSGKSFSYSTILVRGYGEKIHGLGGTASGPKILVDGIENICKILDTRAGKKLRSIEVLDICNIIGSVVVSGNIRRSAQIALGDPDDYLFIRAKRWDLGDIPNWRALSNNTIYADDFSHIQPDIWEGYNGNGECYGFFNIKLAQKVGRIKELRKDNGEGSNPCCEIVLANKECCNLSELYLNNIESKEELIECAKLLYKTQKAICNLKFIHEDTTKIVKKNMRIGIGITGVCQSLNKLEWLDECYKTIREYDKQWSTKKGYAESIRITTIKPSGTLSLLAGATPGIHPAYSQYYIRRIRMSSDDKLVATCKELGYNVEPVRNFDETINYTTVIVEFPCYAGENVFLAKDMTAVKQLELVKQLMTLWADNSISVTVYYNKEELPEIKKWLKEHYKDSIKSVSFLLHKEHGFKQAPYEEITKEQYEERIAKVKSLKDITVEKENIDFEECSKGTCPIK